MLITLVQSKYQNPREKQQSIIPAKTALFIAKEIHVFPFPYQHTYAKQGDKTVSPYQIFIYSLGLNPLNKTV